MTNEGAGEAELRQEMVKACRVLYAAKAVGDGLGGHLSTRLVKSEFSSSRAP